MDTNIIIKIDDLRQPAAQLTLEQLQAVVGGYRICDWVATVHEPYGTEDYITRTCHWDQDPNSVDEINCRDGDSGSGGIFI